MRTLILENKDLGLRLFFFISLLTFLFFHLFFFTYFFNFYFILFFPDFFETFRLFQHFTKFFQQFARTPTLLRNGFFLFFHFFTIFRKYLEKKSETKVYPNKKK